MWELHPYSPVEMSPPNPRIVRGPSGWDHPDFSTAQDVSLSALVWVLTTGKLHVAAWDLNGQWAGGQSPVVVGFALSVVLALARLDVQSPHLRPVLLNSFVCVHICVAQTYVHACVEVRG